MGKRVRVRRLAAWLMQEQLGAVVGIPRSFTSFAEQGGDVSALKLWRLTDALQVPLADFLTDEDGAG